MYSYIYVESEVIQHPRTIEIIKRFPAATTVECDRYTEIFNRKAQDFRLQKQQPALILARKHSGHVQVAPPGYGVGSQHNYYFSPMLNCLYDCRYCFLQGMYRSANHVIFVNYEDFSQGIQTEAAKFTNDEQVWFFSGYDCDSLALEPVAGMAQYFLDTFEHSANAWLELRTKSTQIRSLMGRNPIRNVVCAFSFTPKEVSNRIELRVPGVEKRLAAMLRLQEQGWTVGLRFDPLIFVTDYRQHYQELFEAIFSTLDSRLIHSVSIGVFRLPRDFYKVMTRLYPDDAFLAQAFIQRDGQISYPAQLEFEIKNWCLTQLKKYIDDEKIFLAELTKSSDLSELEHARIAESTPMTMVPS